MNFSRLNPESVHICVVIPLYKASNQIVGVLQEIPAFIRSIVVIDDCSPDDSFERASTVRDERICFVRHHQNNGVGGAVLSGYQKAIELGAEIIVKMDADGQMDPAYLFALIKPILNGEADYTKGNRFLHSQQLKSMPVIRRIGNMGLSFLTKLASGYWNVFDPSNGYTAINTSTLNFLNFKLLDRRYFFETSMLIELGLLRAVVKDVYIPARYFSETSNLSEWNTLLYFPFRLFKGLIKRIWIQYFLKDFSLVSLYLFNGSFLLGFGVIFGIYHWLRSSRLQINTSTGTVMLAVLPIILGVQFIIQAIALDIQNTPSQIISQDESII